LSEPEEKDDDRQTTKDQVSVIRYISSIVHHFAKEISMSDMRQISVNVNGRQYDRTVEPRLLLSDFLRHDLGLTGTHVGCEHGVCGTCTILLDGQPVRSCLMFAVQVDGCEIATVEGLGTMEKLHPIQQAFREAHGVQCGFCTPGLLMTLVPFLEENPDPSEPEIRQAICGNLCRCTGYQHIVDAVLLAAEEMRPEHNP
jgi:carbon-monoxide dehydrogenase small subunit